MTMTLDASRRRTATVLNVSGDIDVYSAPELRDALAHLIKNATGGIVLDLSGTDFIDSSALGVLVHARNQLEGNASTLKLVCTKPHLLRVFEITRLNEIIPICASVAAAVA